MKTNSEEKDSAKKDEVKYSISDLLKKAGVSSFSQLTNLSKEELAELDKKIPHFSTKFKTFDWNCQDKRFTHKNKQK
jgi:predicted flap endonuclease-1-like 5' DNA nuclease